MSFHYNSNNSYLFVNGREIYKFKAGNKKNFPYQCYLGSISNKFDYPDAKEVFLKINIYYDTIDKSDILNIKKYSMIKNNI